MEERIAPKAAFCLLWMCGVCLRLTILAVPPVIAIIQKDLNLSGTQIGLLAGIPIVMFAIFAAPGSIVIARMGVRGALVGALAVAAAGTLVRTGVSNAWELYLTSALMSAGVAIMQPAMTAAVREWAPAKIGIWNSGLHQWLDLRRDHPGRHDAVAGSAVLRWKLAP